ncbi:MAG: extracellular solute-binding protein [Clostridia bacterium]|nr:extracellular solute-binding protein [Clostridia bacterium]
MKLKAKLALLLTLVMLCSFCAVQASAEEVTLRVALWDYSNTEYYKTMISGFEAANPGIKVEVVEFSAAEYSDTIVVKMTAQEDYDVIFMKGLPEMAALINQGALMPLDELAEGYDFAPYGGTEQSLVVDGVLYGMPFRKDNNLIFYNKDLFDAAGVEYPHDGMTFEEYLDLAREMTSGEGADKVYGTHVHTWASNVYMYSRFIDEYVYNDASTWDALIPYYEGILALQNEGVVQDYGSLKSGNIHYSGVFYKQEAAMMQIGTWYINMLLENIPSEDYASFNWGVCSIPNDQGITTENVVGGLTPVAIGAYAKHPEEAWSFLAYITGSEGAQILAKTGIVPAWAGQEVLDIFDGFHNDHPNAPEGLSKYLTGNFVIEQPMDANGKAIAAVGDEMHSAIMTGSMSVEDAIAEYKAKAIQEGAAE